MVKTQKKSLSEANQLDTLVSIVTPVYNAEKFLIDTVRSVQEQSYSNWELLLIDDCSTDKSLDIIQKLIAKDKRIKLLRMKCNSGAGLSRNTGTKAAKGKYLAFLDADDVWVKKKLEKQIAFMQEGGYAFTYGGYMFADENGEPTGKRVFVPENITYKQALKNHIISTPSVMLDLDKIDKYVIKMPDIRSGQDAATWWKILRHIDTAYGINETLFYYRRSTNSLSANKFKAMKRTWHLLTKVEKLGLAQSVYSFACYGYSAVKKRV